MRGRGFVRQRALLKRHPQAIPCMNRRPRVCAHLRWHIGRSRKLKCVAPKEHGERDGGLQQCKLVPHAFARPRAEGAVGKVRRVLRGVQLTVPELRVVALPPRRLRARVRPQPSRRVEVVRLRPEPLVPVDIVQGDEDVGAARNVCFDAGAAGGKDVVLESAADEQRRLRVHPQALRDAQARQREAPDVVHVREPVAEVRVDLLPHAREERLVLRQLEDGPRERRGGGLVPGDEHGHEIVAQLLGVGVFPARVHQEAEQRRVF
mmetsp:Transcript_18145/g.68779  ORF Transcript_18145/g.68779 Transcript_18145/m.68779 type:complete len:263 (+) Transcript_18145:954-1742(+)